ncbi:MAG: Nif3-like dinuclear metal center hexameric protein [Myxococcales bacterium]|nr:Nif3-like dinuclear metal center hexameric protein [Myxococcales bacterium]
MPISCQHVLSCLRDFAPPRLALDRDPTGLQVGTADKKIARVLTTLDLTLEVAEEARDLGAGLIISHHAVIYRPLKDLRTDRIRGRILETLIKHDIAVYVPHTALDITEGGLNDHLAQVVGIEAADVLEETDRTAEPPRGIGRIGRLAAPVALRALAARVKERLGAPGVRLTAPDLDADVHKIAVLCGDGRRYIDAAIFRGADALVTGDIDHHSALDARARGLALVDVGHWASERAAGEILANALRERLEGRDVEIVASQRSTQPFTFV